MPETDRADSTNQMAPDGRRWTMRWPIAVVGLLVAGSAAAFVVLTANGSSDESEPAAVVLDLEEVITTDLVEITTFTGTLGFDEGEPITAATAGTLTSTAVEGSVIGEGEVLFTVDGAPTALVYGESPFWRDMGLLPELEPLRIPTAGIVTWHAEEGTTIEQGDVLMRIDDRPIVVLYGDVPAHRSLRRDAEGTDVRQLEAALVALGFDPDAEMSVDEEFSSFTEALVEEWQESVGAEIDGVVDLGEVVFVPSAFTIEDVLVDVGAQVGVGPVMSVFFAREPTEGDDVLTLELALERLGFDANGSLVADGVFTTATESAVQQLEAALGMDVNGVVGPDELVVWPTSVRISQRLLEPGATVVPGAPLLGTSTDASVVSIDLPAADQSVLDEGDRVVVVLPDGDRVAGTVTLKGETAQVSPQGEATFEVVVVLDDASTIAGLDKAPVDVEVVTDRAENVMAVPVTALVALAEGGYAVEVEQPDGSMRLVAVQPGMYADGMVEIVSEGVSPGDRVVAP